MNNSLPLQDKPVLICLQGLQVSDAPCLQLSGSTRVKGRLYVTCLEPKEIFNGEAATRTSEMKTTRLYSLDGNNSGGPVQLQKGILLTRALVYGAQVSPESLELSSLPVGMVTDITSGGEGTHTKGDGHAKVAGYPKPRTCPLDTLN